MTTTLPTESSPGPPRPGSGDGWVTHGGRRYWGRFGAAGMLLRHGDESGTDWFLLARRSQWVHGGNGQWAIPGGAIDAHEDPVSAALREYDEEIGHLPEGWALRGIHSVHPAPGVWSYHTCCADVVARPAYPVLKSSENDAAHWFTRDELMDADLFTPLRQALPDLLAIYST